MNKYEKLTADLIAAYEASKHVLTDVDEGGAMNFDSAGIFLTRWNEAKVKAAAKAAGFYAIKTDGKYLGKSGYFTFSRPAGKGNRQTAFAQEVTEYLKGAGYDTHCYMQLD